MIQTSGFDLFAGQFVRTLCGETNVVSLLLAYKGKLLLTSTHIPHGGGALLLKVSFKTKVRGSGILNIRGILT